MAVQKNISLLPYNSFHLDVNATEFISVKTMEELRNSFRAQEPKLILGGGSNILLTRNVDGQVLKVDIRGINEVKEDKTYIYVRAGAGEPWHGFVQYTMDRNWGGLEN